GEAPHSCLAVVRPGEKGASQIGRRQVTPHREPDAVIALFFDRLYVRFNYPFGRVEDGVEVLVWVGDRPQEVRFVRAVRYRDYRRAHGGVLLHARTRTIEEGCAARFHAGRARPG